MAAVREVKEEIGVSSKFIFFDFSTCTTCFKKPIFQIHLNSTWVLCFQIDTEFKEVLAFRYDNLPVGL